MKQIATVVIYTTYGLSFTNCMASYLISESNTLQYIQHAEEILHILHCIYYKKSVEINPNNLHEHKLALLRFAYKHPEEMLLGHAKQVLITLNETIKTKHHHQATIYRAFEYFNILHQKLSVEYSEYMPVQQKQYHVKNLEQVKKRKKNQMLLIQAINWQMCSIGILLDQWTQHVAQILSPHLLNRWLGYCNAMLSPESFEDLLDHCVKLYEQETKLSSAENSSVTQNYRAYLRMSMSKPIKSQYPPHSQKESNYLYPLSTTLRTKGYTQQAKY